MGHTKGGKRKDGGPNTGRQLEFVRYYAQCANGSEAARKAGYSEKAAARQAWRLLRKPKIQKLLQARLINREVHAQQTYAHLIELGERAIQHVRELELIRRAHPEDYSRAVEVAGRQLERLARIEGILLPHAPPESPVASSLQQIVAAIARAARPGTDDGKIKHAEIIDVKPVNALPWKSIEESGENGSQQRTDGDVPGDS